MMSGAGEGPTTKDGIGILIRRGCMHVDGVDLVEQLTRKMVLAS